MARKGTSPNGQDRLDEAMAMLIQNQVAFLNRVPETDAFTQSLNGGTLSLSARRPSASHAIEAQMAEIIRVLTEHGRLLERLTDAVREKIGFKGQ